MRTLRVIVGFEFFESTDYAFEGSSDVGEIGDTTTDDEDFALRVRCTMCDQIDWVFIFSIKLHRKLASNKWSWRTRTSGLQ